MPRLSKLIEKAEDYLEPQIGPWYERNKKKLPLYAAVGLIAWYFYGMVLNSIRLGTPTRAVLIPSPSSPSSRPPTRSPTSTIPRKKSWRPSMTGWS